MDDSAQNISIVSSDSHVIRAQSLRQSSLKSREQWVMNRVQWISYVQILFNQLQPVHKQKTLFVKLSNYLSALQKILPLLPLQDFYEGGDKTISFQDVHNSLLSLSQ